MATSRSVFPRSATVPTEVWDVRHRAVVALLGAECAALPVFGVFRGYALPHVLADTSVAVLGLLVARLVSGHRGLRQLAAALGLMAAAAAFVHLAGGVTEMHFLFFINLAALSLYQEWVPGVAAVATVVVHHGVLGVIDPTSVFGQEAAFRHPWTWAAIHGGFVLLALAVNLAAFVIGGAQARRDPLTGLADSATLSARLSATGAGGSGSGAALLYVDLDHFKHVNDALGHDAGDEVLRVVARRLLEHTRVEDTAARLGGDEFAVLALGLRTADEVRALAGRLVRSLGEPVDIRGRQIAVGASIGIAWTGLGRDADVVMREADAAMYEAKRGGRSGYRVFHEGMGAAGRVWADDTTALRQAIADGELVVHYQPIVGLGDSRVTGFEALVRWDHPERGLVAPADFIPLAEESGIIVPLGAFVLDEACRQLRIWQDGAGPADLTMSVNVSVGQLRRPDFVTEVATTIMRSGIRAESLVLEITEGVLIDDLEVALDRLHDLKSVGVRLAVDDFGTGYSSLEYLRRFPFDIVKIDRCFTMDIPGGAGEAKMARAIVGFVHALGFTTTVEGIETPGQADFFAGIGCARGQGYLFSKPVDAHAAGALLRRGIQPTDQTRAPAAAGRRPEGDRPIALVVEDSPAMAEVTARHLRDQGYEPIVAGTLADARSALLTLAPAVVFVDLRLPDGDGWSLVEAMRADPRLRATPTVVVTGLIDSTTVERARTNRCAHLGKPFQPDGVGYRVAQAIELAGDDTLVETAA